MGASELSAAVTISFLPVDLGAHFNNYACSSASDTAAGSFNVWGNSYPAAQLPEPGGRISVAGVPFDFPMPRPAGDNIRCGGQFVAVPPGRYDWLHLLTASERRCEDVLALHFDDGEVDFEALRVSDFWAASARFGERQAFSTAQMHYPHHVQNGVPALMWCQRVPVTRAQPLLGLRLPRNVAIHLFGLTLRSETAP